MWPEGSRGENFTADHLIHLRQEADKATFHLSQREGIHQRAAAKHRPLHTEEVQISFARDTQSSNT